VVTSSVQVLWARHDALRGDDLDILTAAERERVDRFHRSEDQQRSATGIVVLRTAVAAVTGGDPAAVDLQRQCATCDGPHGRPLLPGTGLHASISRAGEWVAVALGRDAPLGVDVEAVTAINVDELASSVLAPGERVSGAHDFFVLWTRKEAVVKATGDGLVTPLPSVVVSGATSPAALVSAPGVAPGRGAMTDLDTPSGYAASLAVLTDAGLDISVNVTSWR